MLSFFDAVTDPRVERTKLHLLKDIIGLTICAVLSGCDDWEEIELYGNSKQNWLKQFLTLSNGIPSHDTLNRVFAMLDPIELRDCFISWVQSVAVISEGRVVSIDGKRMCNSGTGGKKGFLHMVSAWCSSNNMVLGQVKTDEKSNEITAIPELLELLMLKGAVITIDAMGCQQTIAKKIVAAEADYVLAVKQNQEFLYDDIQDAFQQTPSPDSHTTVGKGHGRIGKRTCRVIQDMDWLCKQQAWEKVQSIVCTETQKTLSGSGVSQSEQRFYISSLQATAKQFNQIIRQHWAIENKLHWSLDVTFNEDLSTKQAGNAAENFSIITKIALNLLKNNNTKKTSIKKKRLICALNDEFLANTVFQKI